MAQQKCQTPDRLLQGASLPLTQLSFKEEGSDCVAQVVIPTLAPTLDKSFKADITPAPISSWIKQAV